MKIKPNFIPSWQGKTKAQIEFSTTVAISSLTGIVVLLIITAIINFFNIYI